MNELQISAAIRQAIVAAAPRITLAELAREIDVPYTRLNNICNNRTKPTADIIVKIRHYFKLHSGWPSDTSPALTRISLAGTPMATVKVVGRASAGLGITNVDVAEDEILVPERMANLGGLGFIIDGDSMMPALQPGDVALFREARVPRPGYPFLVKTSDGDLKVKILRYSARGWQLQSINPAYPSVDMKDGDELQGLLVAWYRSRGSRETMDSDPSGLKLEAEDYFA